jgi:hypothetical protein
MNCKTCPYWSEEYYMCDASPDQLDDLVCLGRCLLWAMLADDGDEGEEWKP